MKHRVYGWWLQNRLILDQLTASQGGVCVIFGSSCYCTLISDNDVDGGVIVQAVQNLTALHDEMNKNMVDDSQSSFTCFFRGNTVHLLCVLPCAQNLITSTVTKLVSTQMIALQSERWTLLTSNRSDPDGDPDLFSPSSDTDTSSDRRIHSVNSLFSLLFSACMITHRNVYVLMLFSFHHCDDLDWIIQRISKSVSNVLRVLLYTHFVINILYVQKAGA